MLPDFSLALLFHIMGHYGRVKTTFLNNVITILDEQRCYDRGHDVTERWRYGRDSAVR